MKTNNVFRYAVLVGMFLAMVASVYAQANRSGTAAASELLIPVGTRGIALGSSTLSTAVGIEAIYWNPAGLSRMKNSAEAMFSNMNYFADIGVMYGAVGANFEGFGVIGLSIKSLSFGNIIVTTDDDPDGLSGQTYSPTLVNFGLTYSRALTDVISVGVTATLVSEQIARVSSTGFAFSVGIQYAHLAGINGLGLGVALKNIGPQMSFDGSGLLQAAEVTDANRPPQYYRVQAASYDLPSSMEIGLSYERMLGEKANFQINGLFINNNLGVDEYRVGGELSYALSGLQLFGRGGYALAPKADKDKYLYGATAGVGFKYAATGIDITFDYAWRQVKYFGAQNVFSVILGF
jgi:hypothetical protein